MTYYNVTEICVVPEARTRPSWPRTPPPSSSPCPRLGCRDVAKNRKTDSIHHHHHHHYPDGVAYRGFCLYSGTVSASNITSRRWRCLESQKKIYCTDLMFVIVIVIMILFDRFVLITSV